MKSFLEEVAEDLVAKTKGDFKNMVLVFNNNRPIIYLQKYLAQVIQKPFWSPQFLTINDFFAQVSGCKKADAYTQLFVLYEQFRAILKAEGRENQWANPEKFFQIGQTILSDFSQIDADLAQAEKVFAELREIAEIELQFPSLNPEQLDFLKRFWGTFSEEIQMEKQEEFIKMWRRMPVLYQNFHQKLNDLGGFTIGQIYRNVAEGNDEILNLQHFSKIVFIGFNALTKSEVKAFSRWQAQGKTLFYFDTDTHYLNDELQEAGLFMRKNIFKYQLKNELDNQRSFLQKSTKNIQILEAKGHIVQANLLANELHQYFTAQGAKAQNTTEIGKTAVVLLNEKLLLPTLQNIPLYYPQSDDKEIDVNVSMGLSITQSNLYSFVNLWAEVQQYFQTIDGLPYQLPFRHIEAYLWNTYSNFPAHLREIVLNEMLKNQLFNVPIKHLYFNGNQAQIDLFFGKILSANAVLPTFSALLQGLENHLYEQDEVPEMEFNLLNNLKVKVSELQIVVDNLAQLQLIDMEAAAPSLILRLLMQAVQSVNIALGEISLNGLQVIGLLESRIIDFEHLYIVGTNEGILPKISKSKTFIPDSIRRAHQLPVTENQDAVSAYMFYRLLQRAKNVTLIYNSHTDESNTGELSRFVSQIKFELPYQFTTKSLNQQLSTPKPSHILIQKNKAVLEKLEKYFDSHQPKSLSPTGFTTYLACPLQFFFKYIAGISEPDVLEEEIPARMIGSVVHRMMEEFYKPFVKQEIDVEDVLAQRAKVPALLQKCFNLEFFKTEHYTGNLLGNHLVAQKVIEKYIYRILDYDEALMPMKIIALEQRMSVQFELEVWGEKREIKIAGFVDRVDEIEGVTRIVDYKTGSDILKYKSLENMFQPDAQELNKALVQTLLYTLVFEQNFGLYAVSPHLYTLKNLDGSNATHFTCKPDRKTDEMALLGPFLQQEKEQFAHLLKAKIEEIFEPSVPFTQTSNLNHCKYCSFLSICGR